ncbi:SLC13/DASS family transporter, partial [Salmonella enterica]|nr:SLC13/DASS family transporter [Salmonella enterica]
MYGNNFSLSTLDTISYIIDWIIINMEPITLTLCLLVFAIVMFVWEKV